MVKPIHHKTVHGEHYKMAWQESGIFSMCACKYLKTEDGVFFSGMVSDLQKTDLLPLAQKHCEYMK